MDDMIEIDMTDIIHTGIHLNIFYKIQVKSTFQEYFNHNTLNNVSL